MHKAGAVFSPRLSEWFKPSDPHHIEALTVYEVTGEFPIGYLPSEVFEDPGWHEKVNRRIREELGHKFVSGMTDFGRLSALVAQVKCQGFTFRCGIIGDLYCVEATHTQPGICWDGINPLVFEGTPQLLPKNFTTIDVATACHEAALSCLKMRLATTMVFPAV